MRLDVFMGDFQYFVLTWALCVHVWLCEGLFLAKVLKPVQQIASAGKSLHRQAEVVLQESDTMTEMIPTERSFDL